MKNSTPFIVMLILGLLLAAPYSFAHQQKSAITSVSFNPRTHNIEIMHRFRVHDAEHAVKYIFGKDADIIGSTKTQQQFSNYVNKHFSMFTAGSALELAAIGYENDGQFFWVYQETVEPPTLKSLSIRHNALQEIWPSQVNTVNIEGKGKLQTMTFDNSVELLEVTF
ncbi:MAG: DUF6702 family protein [Colwellia polaris]|jgi:hypothetical protein|uniref:DUF6702 family protein n=1 Tax=Colwellia polaris TaxID=326537 RepID=UPI000A1706E5|nr:DUF6702 family protein [Colwellia polaris]|tara:strand:- start:18781 stop:19281 length:501 start_codon:yes stop_codon:yes gene_type:complete